MKLGIDLGTTNTLAAYMENGRPRLIPNSRGRFTTPSVVGLDGNGALLVGESARNQVLSAPTRTIAQVKRSIGRRVALPLGSGAYSPEELSARILQTIRAGARDYLGDELEEAVMTVPAHFDDRQRASCGVPPGITSERANRCGTSICGPLTESRADRCV
jgi:molecular chaperone DnaK